MQKYTTMKKRRKSRVPPRSTLDRTLSFRVTESEYNLINKHSISTSLIKSEILRIIVNKAIISKLT